MLTTFELSIAFLALLFAVRMLFGALQRRRSVHMVEASAAPDSRSLAMAQGEDRWLANWLARAGYRDTGAVSIYVGATVGLTAAGLAGVVVLNRSGAIETMVANLSGGLGPIGDALALVARFASYIVLAVLAGAPTLLVRAVRRKRVESIEEDLAPTLELLATLAEAGLGFDSAIARIQESESGERPLSQELRIYQRDNLGGIPRLESLRKLAQRAGVASVSIFVSALIQAEQVGASLAETLRIQADDLRERRKLRAVLLAQALPVKLVFPLVFCFLPGIFFSTLGPVLSQFVDLADSLIKR